MIWATRGGVTIGIILLAVYLIGWYPGLKALRKQPLEHLGRLAPFAFAWAYGALGILSVMGVIGWMFDTALWVSNWLGDVALWLGVAADAGRTSRGAYLPLTDDGASVVAILLFVVIALVKKSKAGPDIKKGVWCGLCLGTSAGVAGLAAVPLAQAVNWLGAATYGALG